jgi:hypothetical protein
VAAYVALLSGVGISIASAVHLRTSLLALSVAVLLYFTLKRLSRIAGAAAFMKSRMKKPGRTTELPAKLEAKA